MRRHAFDATAFVWGIIFLTLAVYTAFNNVLHLDLDIKWVLPAGLVLLGLVGIMRALRGSRG